MDTLNRTQLNQIWSKACQLLLHEDTIQEGMALKEEYTAALMEKQELRDKATRAMELDQCNILALYDANGDAYCIDCLDSELCNEDDSIYRAIIALRHDAEAVINHPFVVEIIHDDTFQFEQARGDIIPLEGIQCCKCGSELYPAYEGYDDIETCESDTDISDTHVRSED